MDFSEKLKQLRSQYLINDVNFDAELTKLEYIEMIRQVDPDYFFNFDICLQCQQGKGSREKR